MKLKVYLAENELTTKDFAVKLGYSRTHLTLIVNGRSRPSPRLAKDIERVTGGKVTATELLNMKLKNE